VKSKAIEKGLITPEQATTMTRLDVYDLLFHPGFTTKDKEDEFAGRGIGMNVVRENLTEIRGVINTDSTLGKGTTFTVRLPLTLSICKALCCLIDRTRIAFPMDGWKICWMCLKNASKLTLKVRPVSTGAIH
jgi:chemosensory pili system protein ChpA (sensor histidine kinase/response regulator)